MVMVSVGYDKQKEIQLRKFLHDNDESQSINSLGPRKSYINWTMYHKYHLWMSDDRKTFLQTSYYNIANK